MGYGLGVFLLAIGLICVYAINDTQVGPLEVHTLGWILAAAGVLVIALTAITLNSRRSNTTVARTTHPDGSQTVQERQSRNDTPPAV